jgi:hypothetical protein
MATHWNQEFTKRIRSNNSSLWAAVTLGTDVPLGAMGFFNDDNELQIVGVATVDVSPVVTSALPITISDRNVKNTKHGAQISGEFFDPKTQTTVTVGLEWEWTFGSGTNFTIGFPSVSSTQYSNVDDALGAAEVQMVKAGGQHGYLSRGGYLRPGFILVVEILQIAAGFTVGSVQNGSTFNLSGSVNGMNELMDGSAGAAFSSSNMSDSGQMFAFLWPEGANSVASNATLKTVAFVAACFDGTSKIYPYK